MAGGLYGKAGPGIRGIAGRARKSFRQVLETGKAHQFRQGACRRCGQNEPVMDAPQHLFPAGGRRHHAGRSHRVQRRPAGADGTSYTERLDRYSIVKGLRVHT